MKMLLLKPVGGFSIVEADSLEDYYKHLECDLIDIVHAEVDGFPVEIICDDEGLFKADPIPSIFFDNGDGGNYERFIVGNVLFSGPANEEGELTQISKDIAMHIMLKGRTRLYYDKNEGHELTWHVVLDSEF